VYGIAFGIWHRILGLVVVADYRLYVGTRHINK